MSLRALTWAMEHEGCPNSSAKLVLLAFANYANEQHWAYPAIETIGRLTKLNVKTIPPAIEALERLGIIIDTGKRAGRTRQVKVYQLAIETNPKTGVLPKAPENGVLSARKTPVFTGKDTRKRVTNLLREPIPPSDPNGSDSPPGGHDGDDGEQIAENAKTPDGRGHRIADAWTPTPISELPPKAQALARQWPSGAYEAEGEAFANYWAGEGGRAARKVDWNKTWANRIVQVSGQVQRAAKAGVVHASSLTRPAQAVEAMPRDGECDISRAIRLGVKKIVGGRTYDGWIKPAAILVDGDNRVTMRCASAFMSDWLQQHFTEAIERVSREVIGERFGGLQFESGKG